ncbi:MAG: hypothetical protein MJZ37_07985 [Bacilli bacterium]|nr:hypothetical protein [Bacilli bacterium]
MDEKDLMIHKLNLISKELDGIIIKLEPESVEYKDLISASIEIYAATKRIKESKR